MSEEDLCGKWVFTKDGQWYEDYTACGEELSEPETYTVDGKTLKFGTASFVITKLTDKYLSLRYEETEEIKGDSYVTWLCYEFEKVN